VILEGKNERVLCGTCADYVSEWLFRARGGGNEVDEGGKVRGREDVVRLDGEAGSAGGLPYLVTLDAAAPRRTFAVIERRQAHVIQWAIGRPFRGAYPP